MYYKSLTSLKYLRKLSKSKVPPAVEITCTILLGRTHALQPRKLKVHSPLRHKLVVSTLFNDLALVEHVDYVCVLDSTQTMCDSDGGATLRSSVESVLDDALRCRVEC